MKASVVIPMIVGGVLGWIAGDIIIAKMRNDVARQQTLESRLEAIEKSFDEIDEAIALNNVTQENILDYHGRLLHYLSGHSSNDFVRGCPECGLLEQLTIRKRKIDDRVRELSEFISENPDDPTVEAKKAEIAELDAELVVATQKIFSADEQAKKLSKLVKVRIE